ncbi:folylpolyglutamate synthase [Phlyctochytrium bullatum]|nr:folylpolyglutamate synthase [Phlyctochytrium bullatum]
MIELGLEKITKLLEALGNPEQKFAAIHVAGTNGKGSVCAILSSVITKAGIRCGLFTSPHLVSPSDCIRINDVAITDAEYAERKLHVEKVNDSREIKATSFEVLTALAFTCFAKHGVEIAVVEVGMGGRLDATNVFSNPLLCVFTPISFDHMEFLGNTIEAIASEKAGILKTGAKLAIIGKQRYAAAEETIVSRARELNVTYELAQVAEGLGVEKDLTGQKVAVAYGSQVLHVFTRLVGDFQLINIGIAFSALNALERVSAFKIGLDAVTDGLASVRWPGRMQPVKIKGTNLSFTLDGAHNDHGLEVLASFVDKNIRPKSVSWIIGMKKGKDPTSLLKPLLREGDSLFCVGFSSPVDMPWVSSTEPEKLASSARELVPGIQCVEYSTFDALVDQLSPEMPIIACGSLYFAADVLRSPKVDQSYG